MSVASWLYERADEHYYHAESEMRAQFFRGGEVDRAEEIQGNLCDLLGMLLDGSLAYLAVFSIRESKLGRFVEGHALNGIKYARKEFHEMIHGSK